MFSGLIAYRGAVVALDAHRHGGATLAVRCEGARAERAEAKDSIAIDGVCLTATAVDGEVVSFDVVPETLACSTLGERLPGELVNVEYALRVGDRLGRTFGLRSRRRGAARAGAHAGGAGRALADRDARAARADDREQGIRRARRRERHGGGARPAVVRGRAHPRDADAHDARRAGSGQPRQPRGRSVRALRQGSSR